MTIGLVDALELIALTSYDPPIDDQSISRGRVESLVPTLALLEALEPTDTLWMHGDDVALPFGYADAYAASLAIAAGHPVLGKSDFAGTYVGNHNGAYLTQAAGMGWAMRTKNESALTLALFPAALAESAEFHNALNFAGVVHARTLFVALNHGEKHSVDRAGVAYGVPAEFIECDSLTSIPGQMRAMVEKARASTSPLLLEVHLGRFADLSRDALMTEVATALSLSDGERRETTERCKRLLHAAQALTPLDKIDLRANVFARKPWNLV